MAPWAPEVISFAAQLVLNTGRSLPKYPSLVSHTKGYYAPINVKPQGGVGGGTTCGKLTERAFP